MRFSVVIIVLILISCNKPKEADAVPEKPKVFTVAPDILQAFPDGQRSFASSADYYSDKNFIIDETGRIFFYGRKDPRHWGCGTRDDKEDLSVPKPKFINLHPSEIIEIPQNSIKDFIKLNAAKNVFDHNFCIIASARDTFTSAALDSLFTQLYTHQKALHVIRRMTEEEKVVMRYKKNGEHYDPGRIEWDTTKIEFPEQD